MAELAIEREQGPALGMKFRHAVRGCLEMSPLTLTKAPEVEFFSESAMAEVIGDAKTFEEAMALVSERGPEIGRRLMARLEAITSA